MKKIYKVISIILCIMIILSFMPNVCFALDLINSENIIKYNIPLNSTENRNTFLTLYRIEEKYYLDLKNIAALTRCTYEENNEIILLTQGTRKLEFNIKTCNLNDSDIKNQERIDLKKYDGMYLCEAIPMLNYLGAECSIDKKLNTFNVLMPEITFWEAFMPDYLDYHFNTEDWIGNETEIEISLTCDIIMDLLDVTKGHGIFVTADDHYKDALYDILDIDLYSYESVQQIIEKQTNKLQDFLLSDNFSNFFNQGSIIGQELFNEYADYYMTFKIVVDSTNEKYQYLQENYKTAAEIGQKINKNICKQIELQNNGQNTISAAALALDIAYNTYKLMCYDKDSRTLFSNCITDEVEKFTKYEVPYLKKITNKISSEIKTDQSIVANAITDQVTNWILSETQDRGIEKISSAFKNGNIYMLAAKVAMILVEIPLRNEIDAYSDDMDMLWLAATQTDIAQLATRYMLIAIKDEKASNIEHIEMVKNLMSLYYRTTIAFCDNAIVACEQFGNSKTKAKTCEYLKQVSNYMAAYLYLMTNCKIVPIVDYNELSDTVLTNDWVESYNYMKSNVCAYQDILDTLYYGISTNWSEYDFYNDDISNKLEISYMWYMNYNISLHNTGYTFIDIDGNGISELLVSKISENTLESEDEIIYDLYTLHDKKIIHLASSGERSRYYLCENNIIANEGSGGANNSIYNFYTINQNKNSLVLKECVIYDSYENEKNPWTYRNMENKTTDEFILIKENDAQQIINSYKHLPLKLNLFSDYIPSHNPR